MNPFTLNANPKKKNHAMFIFVFAGHVKHCHFQNVRITHITTLPKIRKQRVFFFLDICWKHCPSKPKKYISTSLCSSLQVNNFLPWLTMVYLGLMPNKWQYLIIRILRSTHT
ncbi:hypothetical protein ACB094_05G220000 [Castanea mollissima]